MSVSFHLRNSGNTMNIFANAIVSFVFLAFIVFSSANADSDERLKTIFFRLYKGTNQTYTDVYLENTTSLIEKLNFNDPTVVYIHGYTESTNSRSVHTVVNAYMNRSNHNVIVVDWSIIANQDYVRVSIGVKPVGTAVARALNALVYAKLPAEKIHVIGHSMGSHVTAFVGRNVNFTLERISGLDPAGPLFNFIGEGLSHTDAKFVDVIHTDMGLYGYAKITEGADFFPNHGRRVQPGCPIVYVPFSPEAFCSHHRSWHFYAESVLNPNAFFATKCSLLAELPLIGGRKNNDDLVPMGYATPSNVKGRYCLVTNSQSPYGKGEEGAVQ